MWGRGRLNCQSETLILEQTISEPLQDLCNGMEHAGLNQERREIVSSIENMQWQWLKGEEGSSDLNISFALASGHYATSVLQEFMRVTEPDRYEDKPFVYNASESISAPASESKPEQKTKEENE
jgi:tRNA pseudouridine13 synthase